MLILRDQQIQAFRDGLRRTYHRGLVEKLQQTPALANLPEPELEALLKTGLELAGRYDLFADEHIIRLTVMLARWGMDFESHVDPGGVRSILRDPHREATDKLNLIEGGRVTSSEQGESS